MISKSVGVSHLSLKRLRPGWFELGRLLGRFKFLGPGVGPVSFLGLGFPSNPLKTRKGALFIPRLLLGPDFPLWFLRMTFWNTFQRVLRALHFP